MNFERPTEICGKGIARQVNASACPAHRW